MSSIVWLSEPGRGLVRSKRPGQLRMAQHVEAIAEAEELPAIAVVQAGTGTGKSLALLVPSVGSKKVRKVVYSTGKKALQKQVVETDLPRVAGLVADRPFAKRLGKGNYVCQLRYDDFINSGAERYDPSLLARFRSWLDASPQGEFSEFGEPVPFDYMVRVGECLKHQCPYRHDCGYLGSLQDARDAEILVVNHALLAFDLAAGGGKVLGKYDMLVIDEAHQAPEAFRSAWTLRWHPKQAVALEAGMRVDDRLNFPQGLHAGYREIAEGLDETRPGKIRVLGTDLEGPFVDVQGHLTSIKAQLQEFGLWSEPGEDADDEGGGEELDAETAKARARTRVVAANVSRLLNLTKVLLAEPDTQYDPLTGDALATRAPTDGAVEYLTFVSRTGELPEMSVTPVEIGPLVTPALKAIGKVVITSATIATGNNLNNCFDYTLRQFGLADRDVKVKDIVASPFEYKECATLFVDATAKLRPEGYDMTKAARASALKPWYDDMAERMHEFLEASRGGAFILCASREDLEGFASSLREYERTSYRVGVQERSDDGSVKWFKEDPSSVLLGLKSLWEGVDVPGLGLRLVIVPRLPFPNAGDILLGVRKDRYKAKLRRGGVEEKKIGYQTFTAFDLNIAAQELAQGFGRLIRREDDMGVGVCLDPRLTDKPYAGILRSTIPLPLWTGSKERLLNHVRTLARAAFTE